MQMFCPIFFIFAAGWRRRRQKNFIVKEYVFQQTKPYFTHRKNLRSCSMGKIVRNGPQTQHFKIHKNSL
jgi:hypothetical protein